MFWTPTVLDFFFYRQPADMRKGFDGLCGIITGILKQDPLSGAVYIFVNKRRDRIKLLLWDGDGFWIFYKRLEKGTFQIPEYSETVSSLELTYAQLVLILQGIDLSSVKRRRRYHHPVLNRKGAT